MRDQWHLFWQQVLDTDWLQWVAVISGVAEVLFAKANKIWLYPASVLSTLIYIYVFFDSKLYADSLLSGYYFFMSIYGWWYWAKKKNKPPVKITKCSMKDWAKVAIISIGGFCLLAFLLRYTPSNVPFWDAWVTATAWAGMWLLAKRKLENWILLNLSNAFAVPLYLYKQLPMTAVLTVFLFVVAVFGFFDWRNILKKESKVSLADAH